MERIKQAIEKVKSQRLGDNNRPMSRSDYQSSTNKPRISQADDELGDMDYVYTRVVPLEAEHLKNNRIVAFDKNDPQSMSFDLLRTHVLQKMEENGWRTLAITSPTSEAGKTVVAINLAMSISQLTNKTALLVDFDLRRPKVGQYLGVRLDSSLNDLLEGTVALPDVLLNPHMPRLVVLPTNSPAKNSSETLSSRRISELISELRERYQSRVVIFDLPPMLVSDDVMVLLPQIDCFLMVVANGMSTRQEIEDSLRLLPSAKLLGTILNKADVGLRGYYYD